MNTTVIFVSHNIIQSYRLADYLYVMDEGKIIEYGTPEEIIKKASPRTKEILQLEHETI